MRAPVPLFWLAALPAGAVDLYSTGFENFTAGADRIAGAPAAGSSPAIPATDSWSGSHPRQDRSGVFEEATHAVPGIGNAAYIGGNPAPITSGGTSIFVRKVFNYQPVTAGNEVLTVRALVGITDSSTGLARDNFEFLIYNNSSPSTAIAGVQFDNQQLNTSGRPYQAVYRYTWDTVRARMVYADTMVTFTYDAMQELEMRINFRTNKWTATLDSVPLFSDVDFYKGPSALNFGSLLIQCKVTYAALPGTNYMLFDDLSLTAAPPDAAAAPDLTWSATSGVQLRWPQEAGYFYQVRWTENGNLWQTPAGGASAAAAVTGYTGLFNDSTAPGRPRRFYQITRLTP